MARARDENRLDRRFAATRDYLARKAEMIAERCPRRKDPKHECVPAVCQAYLSPEHLDVVDDFAFLRELVDLGKKRALRDGLVLSDGELAVVLRKNGLATYLRTKSQLRAELRALDEAVSDDLTFCSDCHLGLHGPQEYIAHRAICPVASTRNDNCHAVTPSESDADDEPDTDDAADEHDEQSATQDAEEGTDA